MFIEKNLVKKYIRIIENLYINYSKKFQNQNVGVFISGGIDSSIIAYFTSKFFKNPLFLTLSGKKSLDLNYVKILNNFLKQKLTIVDFNKQKISKIKPGVIEILKNSNLKADPTQISLACAFFLLCEKAKEENIKIIFTGQGPDILLAGYHMYQNLPREKLNEKIKKDLSLLEIDKKRDQSIADAFEIKLINPYLEKEFINFSLELPAELKINQIGSENYEKYLSRKVGEYLKLPKEIILRHKKALQYSTKIRKYI